MESEANDANNYNSHLHANLAVTLLVGDSKTVTRQHDRVCRVYCLPALSVIREIELSTIIVYSGGFVHYVKTNIYLEWLWLSRYHQLRPEGFIALENVQSSRYFVYDYVNMNYTAGTRGLVLLQCDCAVNIQILEYWGAVIAQERDISGSEILSR